MLQRLAVQTEAAGTAAAGEGCVVGSSRQGPAVSGQGSDGAGLSQLRQGAPEQRQETLHLRHQRLHSAVLLERGQSILQLYTPTVCFWNFKSVKFDHY